MAGEHVLDAACGEGYGRLLVTHAGTWTGIDQADVVHPAVQDRGRWIQADLCEWVPDQLFDVALSFETLEHVVDPDRLISTLCMARRLVLCSVPVVPTVGINPYHLHDFEADDLPKRFANRGWPLHQMLMQPSELSAIYIFAR